MGITLTPYRWRGKIYKTISGLHNAMMKKGYGAFTSISFDAGACYLRARSGSEHQFIRLIEDGVSEIADKSLQEMAEG